MKLFSTRIQLSVFFFLISYSILSFFFFKRFHFHLFIFFSLLVFVSLEDRPNFYFWFFKISHKIEFHTFFQNRQMKIVSIHYFFLNVITLPQILIINVCFRQVLQGSQMRGLDKLNFFTHIFISFRIVPWPFIHFVFWRNTRALIFCAWRLKIYTCCVRART